MKMDINNFYNQSPALWKTILGEDLHYHVGWGDGDIFYNSIKYLYQFIGHNKKVLDCGCGWGGTAKVLQRDLNCKVTGITNSSYQYDYINKNINTNVKLADLHDYIPKENYDTALFVESYCHLSSPEKVLSNISRVSNRIIIREYHLKTDQYPTSYVDRWFMNIHHKDVIIKKLRDLDYDLVHQAEHYDYALEPTLDLWYNNIKKLSKKDKTKHIKTLEASTRFLKRNKDEVLRTVGLSTFVFEKC